MKKSKNLKANKTNSNNKTNTSNKFMNEHECRDCKSSEFDAKR